MYRQKTEQVVFFLPYKMGISGIILHIKYGKVLADVFHCTIMLASKYNFDIKEIVLEKLAKTAVKYPVEKAKGNSKKYSEL